RARDAPARVAASAESGGALRWDLALCLVDRRASHAAAARPAGPERARNQPASRFARPARAPDRTRLREHAGCGRYARLGPDPHAREAARLPFHQAREEAR